MKQAFTYANRFAEYLVTIALVLVPFEAFLAVWASSLFGHYTGFRLLDDVVLLALLSISCYWIAKDEDLRIWFTDSLLVRLITAYIVLTFLLGIVSYTKGEVTRKALAYGVLINLRFFVWFLVVLLSAQRSSWLRRNWLKLVIWPATIVVTFAVLQYTILPTAFLSHFGYNAATTIAPIETINHNKNYIRVQSTLRGANPLGAYLVIVVSTLGVLFVRGKRKFICTVLGLVTLGALYASGSRSAWIGVSLSLGLLAWLQLKDTRQRTLFGAIGLIITLLAVGGYVLLRSNVTLQNEVLHTQTHSTVKTTSNGAHVSALRNGIKDVIRQPFGDGPGTAGPASEYNGSHPVRIAEDYYVQVAQETGWLGLALFVAILTLVAVELYGQVGNSRLALVAFVSCIGIAFVNLLSHAWADDTLAFVWWGLAGIALGRPYVALKRKNEV
jgi:hypothetical protein